MPRIPSLPLRSLVLVLAVCVGTAAAQNAGSGRQPDPPNRFDRIVIPRIEFRDATPAEAFQFLARKAKESDPPGSESSTPPIELDHAKLPDVRITLSLRNASLTEAFRHTAAIAGVPVTFSSKALRINVPPIGSLPRLGSRVDGSTRLAAAQRRLLDKAGRLILPRLHFRDATVREAADFLRKRSTDLDAEEPNPANRGFDVVLINPPNPDGKNRITLIREKTPLLELLATIGGLSGGELRVSNAAFILDFTDPKSVTRDDVGAAER